MKPLSFILSFSLAAPFALPVYGLQAAGGQSLLPAGDAIGLAADPSAGNSPDDYAYADGVRAINAGKWSDAITIFTRVAAQGYAHAEGALYWKAYAENKQGQTGTALDTCSSLRREHPDSTWLEECGALEIEIHAKSGKPVPPGAERSDDLKLLALASLMQHDEKKALEQIDQILNNDAASEKLKQGALFIMGEHHSDTIYPQIARLSFVDGDVRIQRGQESGHRKDVTWEAASSGVPLESGFSIVTGEGRAEIELEDASTLYLAPNSVLTINDLSTTGGVPHTDLALLSGTVSLRVRPYIAGEVFLLRTPTDNLLTRYPMASNLRVTSYVDGIALAASDGGALAMGLNATAQEQLPRGQTLYFKEGRRILEAGPIHPEDFSGWDQWVSGRYTTRSAALAEITKESGLAAPLPGMADMAGKGRFFDCEPYGKCWEPTAPATTGGTTQTAQAQTPVAETAVAQSSSAQSPSAHRNIQFIGPPAASGPPPGYVDTFLPCIPEALQATYLRAVLPANATVSQQLAPAWAWTICHSGGWIFADNHYRWVVGHRHHRPCEHWVKDGHTVAFLPINPHDVKDHLPVNRRAPAFVVDSKNGHILEHVALDNAHPIQLLKEPPREFRAVAPMPLPRAADPKMEVHQLKPTAIASGAAPRPVGIPITFDHRSQSFMMPNHALEGSRPATSFRSGGSGMVPITNRGGDLQSHSGVYNGSSGFHGSSGGGGGYHGGASSSSGGGSSHSSGGSSGSVSTSSVSSSSSSSSSSNGGSHK